MTYEEFLKQPSKNNPNVTMEDMYDEQQRQYLYKFETMSDEDLKSTDAHWLQERGIKFSNLMESLLDNRYRAQPAPLPEPPVPEEITGTDEWQAYLDANKGLKNFVPTTDPEAIRRIISPTNPYFTMEKLREGIEREVPTDILRGTLQTGLSAAELIGEGVSYITPKAIAFRKWNEQKELARVGIPYEEGASALERFKGAFVPRGYTPETVANIAYSSGEPIPEDPFDLTAEYLYPGRPPGQQGPIIRKTRNAEGGIEKIFPFNDPGVTAEDFYHFGVREAIPLAGDLLVSAKILKTIKAGKKGKFYESPWKKVRNWGKFAAASGFGTAAADFSRLAAGVQFIDPDLTWEEAMREAGLIGAYATAGAGAATAILSGTRASWNFFTGKNPPAFMVRKLTEVRNNYQQQLKARNIEEGTPEAKALFDEIIGQTPKEVQKRIEDVTGKTYKIFLGEGQFNPDANFALSLLAELETLGLPKTQTMAMLQEEILNNDIARQIFAQKLLLSSGTEEGAKKAAAELGQQLGNETIPKVMNAEIESAWSVFRRQVEEGIIDQDQLIKLGIDDAALLGLKPATNALPGELGDDIAMSKFLFKEIADPTSKKNALRDPRISRLHRLQRDYIVPVQNKLENLLNTYGALKVNMNVSSPMAIEMNKILKGGGISILRRDKAFKEYLIKNVDGPDIRQSIARLEGRARGKFGSENSISFDELHQFRIDLHQLRNQLSGKLNEPSEDAVLTLISAVERQQDLILMRAANQIKPKGIGVKNWMKDTGFGDDYWKTLDEYRRRSKLANNRYVNQLMKSGAEFDESLLPALMAANQKGSYTHPLAEPLMTMLREQSEEGGLEAINAIQKAVAQRYRRDVVEPFMGERNYQGMREAHEKWMENNGGLIRSVFPEEKAGVWDHMGNTQRLTKNLVEAREKTFQRIADEFGLVTERTTPEEMILSIVRGEGYENAAGATAARKKLAKIIKDSKDKTLKTELNHVIRKDIFNQITVTDPIRGGMTGLKRIDPQALNDLLTKDFLVGAGDAAQSVSFAKSYGMFLTKQQIDDLYKLNAAVQSEIQRKTAGRNILQEAGAIGAKEDLSVSTVGKLIFGPLNPYTYRFGWRQRALAEKTQELLTEMVYDPDLLRKVMNQINRKADIDQTVRFLYSLDSVVAHDLGRELQLNYMEPDGENPFRSQDSMDYIKEFFSPVGTKTRGPKPGVIPGREILENAPILLPTAAALTGTVVGQNLSDKLLDRGAN